MSTLRQDEASGKRGDGGARSRSTGVGVLDRSVALLNRGTPGGVVTPDGTLHMSLMRSCSAWPSGIWIDGDRRNAPDGSSFAYQHWSHTFEYALAAGTGDWRAAGFSPPLPRAQRTSRSPIRMSPPGKAVKIMAFLERIGLGAFARSGAWSSPWRNTRPC